MVRLQTLGHALEQGFRVQLDDQVCTVASRGTVVVSVPCQQRLLLQLLRVAATFNKAGQQQWDGQMTKTAQ
jgi:hypothetical protein